MEKLEFVSKKEQKLFDLILRERPNLNFQMLKEAVRKRDIKVNQKRVSQNTKLKNGDLVTIFLPQKKQKNVPVVFQNKDVLIVNKPAGMEVTKKDKAFLQSDCLEDIFCGCFACHRLDKNTEGLVVLAKTRQAQNLIFDAIKQHKMHKFYVTIVTGKVKKSDEFEDYLQKGDKFVKVFDKPAKDVKVAKTNYVLLEEKQNLALLQIEILIGRTHQIWAQLAHHGIFVLGDEKYGDKQKNKLYHTKRQLLCAQKICFDDLPKSLSDLSQKMFEVSPSFCLDDILSKSENK